MRIGFDVDGVLADFNAAYIQRCIDVTGRDLFPPRPFDITTWNYPESYGYTESEVHVVWEGIKRDERFWRSLVPYGAMSIVANFANRYWDQNDIYFITSRPGATAKLQTEMWLRGRGVEGPTVLISSDKGECAHALNLTHYIDDRTENCEDVTHKSPSTTCYMLAQPWNQEIPDVPRISSVLPFINLLR